MRVLLLVNSFFIRGLFKLRHEARGHKVLLHFGPTYQDAKYALYIMIIASFFGGVTRFSAALLIYAGYEGLASKFSVLQLFMMVLLVAPATYFGGRHLDCSNYTGYGLHLSIFGAPKTWLARCTVHIMKYINLHYCTFNLL